MLILIISDNFEIIIFVFTGIIETTAKVLSRDDHRLIIERPEIYGELQIGQSIANNGACLTIIDLNDRQMIFDVVPETFHKTNLGSASIVNLERALKADGRFEGHVVQGHVDGVVKLLERIQEGAGERLVFVKPPDYERFFVTKGSVCLNGISLTVAKDNPHSFEVAIIPHTLQFTNFGSLDIGSIINFECDIFLKYLDKKFSNLKFVK